MPLNLTILKMKSAEGHDIYPIANRICWIEPMEQGHSFISYGRDEIGGGIIVAHTPEEIIEMFRDAANTNV